MNDLLFLLNVKNHFALNRKWSHKCNSFPKYPSHNRIVLYNSPVIIIIINNNNNIYLKSNFPCTLRYEFSELYNNNIH